MSVDKKNFYEIDCCRGDAVGELFGLKLYESFFIRSI